MTSLDFSPALTCLKKAKSALITSHVRPDGDSLGSALGLAHILKSNGVNSEIILTDDVPDRYTFLFEQDTPRVIGGDWTKANLTGFDTMVVVDTSVQAQLGPQFDFLTNCHLPVLVIDHHLKSESIGTVNLFDRSASATGLLIAELAQASHIELTPLASKALFTAIASDTGWFRFPNADARTYQQVAQLVATGVRPTEIYTKLYLQAKPAKLRLQARALASLELFCNDRLACMTLTQEDFTQTHANPTHTEGLINESLQIASVTAAIMLTEQPDHSVRVNLRSKGPVNVAQIAQRFGGGGHKLAAGLQLADSLDQVKQQLVLAITQVLAHPDETTA